MSSATPLSRACGWIDAHLEDFRLDRSPGSLLPSLKALAELAHAADFLLRVGDPRLAATGERWLAFAWSEIAGGEELRRLIEGDARLAPVAMAFLPFHLRGYRNPALLAAISRQLPDARVGALGWTLLVPVLRILGVEPGMDREEQARPLSVLLCRTPAAHMPEDAVYVLAHECLYAAAWGLRAPRYGPDTAAYVAEALPALIARFRDLGDPDVLAELILVAHALALPCVDRGAWQVLRQKQQAAGNVVPIRKEHALLRRVRHPTLLRTYHTTLAAILAWSACRHRRQRQARRAIIG